MGRPIPGSDPPAPRGAPTRARVGAPAQSARPPAAAERAGTRHASVGFGFSEGSPAVIVVAVDREAGAGALDVAVLGGAAPAARTARNARGGDDRLGAPAGPAGDGPAFFVASVVAASDDGTALARELRRVLAQEEAATAAQEEGDGGGGRRQGSLAGLPDEGAGRAPESSTAPPLRARERSGLDASSSRRDARGAPGGRPGPTARPRVAVRSFRVMTPLLKLSGLGAAALVSALAPSAQALEVLDMGPRSLGTVGALALVPLLTAAERLCECRLEGLGAEGGVAVAWALRAAMGKDDRGGWEEGSARTEPETRDRDGRGPRRGGSAGRRRAQSGRGASSSGADVRPFPTAAGTDAAQHRVASDGRVWAGGRPDDAARLPRSAPSARGGVLQPLSVPPLARLRLSGFPPTPAMVEALSAVLQGARSLEHLSFGQAHFEYQGMAQLVAALVRHGGCCDSLRSLELEACVLGAGGAAALAVAIPQLWRLEHLALLRCTLGEGGALAVARSAGAAVALDGVEVGGAAAAPDGVEGDARRGTAIFVRRLDAP